MLALLQLSAPVLAQSTSGNPSPATSARAADGGQTEASANGDKPASAVEEQNKTPKEPKRPARERPNNVKLAREHFKAALEHYRLGHYRAAIEELSKALKLDPTGKDLVFNLAMLHEKLGELDEAADFYEKYREMDPSPAQKERVDRIITRLEGARQRQAAAQEDAKEETEAREVEPPAPMKTRVVVRRERVEAGLRRQAVYALAGVAASALVLGGVFALSALLVRPEAETGGDVTIGDIERESARSNGLAIAADVSLLIGLAAGLGSGVLYFTEPAAPPTQPQSSRPLRFTVRVAF